MNTFAIYEQVCVHFFEERAHVYTLKKIRVSKASDEDVTPADSPQHLIRPEIYKTNAYQCMKAQPTRHIFVCCMHRERCSTLQVVNIDYRH
jgi:hypothetical protein